MTDERASIHERITNQIVAAIEAGADAFRMPWHHDGSVTTRPINIASGRGYRGANILVLWAAAETAGFTSGIWGTYRQWTARRAQVRQGERGTTIIFWRLASTEDNESASGDDPVPAPGRPRMFGRGYTVFNRCQVDGFEDEQIPRLDEAERIRHADAFFNALRIPARFDAASAFYRPSDDRIFMPPFSAFVDPLAFYGVLFHEAGHATGAKHRLDRNLEKRFSVWAAAMEEIVAELTAAFILADLGLAFQPRPDHAAYVASWIETLQKDPRAIFAAAGQAQAAADWMHASQPDSATAHMLHREVA
jgi:antirestriction protein ArdC